MSDVFPHIVPAYHGTSQTKADAILENEFRVDKSHDGWFGSGTYFWEADPYLTILPSERAAEHDGSEPTTLLSSIDLTHNCLDLTTKKGKQLYKSILDGIEKTLEEEPDLAAQFDAISETELDHFLSRFMTGRLGIQFYSIRAICYPGNRHFKGKQRPKAITSFELKEKVSRALVNFGILITIKDAKCILKTELSNES